MTMVSGGLVVRNTFFEFSDPSRNDNSIVRQMSEPTSPKSRMDENDNCACEHDARDHLPEFFFSDSDNDDNFPHYSAARDFAPLHESDASAASCHGPSKPGDADGPVAKFDSSSTEASGDATPVTLPLESCNNAVSENRSPSGKAAASGRRNLNKLKDNNITKMPPPWADGITTVMMRNLPNRYVQQKLLDELREAGFASQQHFNFFYLPMDHSNAANLGYCFINFTETVFANAFAEAFQGKKMLRFKSNKTVVVMAASIQGYEKNHAYYSSTRIALAEDQQYRPLFFKQPGQAIVAKGTNQMRVSQSKVAQPKSDAGKRGKKSKEHAGKAWASNAGEMPGSSDVAIDAPSNRAPTKSATSVSATNFCLACGNDCGPDHRFCPFCGSVLGQNVVKQAWSNPMNSGMQTQMSAMPPMQTLQPMAAGSQTRYAVWDMDTTLQGGMSLWMPPDPNITYAHDKTSAVHMQDPQVGASGTWPLQKPPYMF